MIIKRMVVSPFETNCYIIGCEETKKAAVIDPGDSVDSVIEAAETEGLTIEKIINTHAHIDHAAGVQEMKKALNIPFLLHKDDEELLPLMPDTGLMYGMHVTEVPSVDEYISHGDIVEIGSLKLEVLHTPGHTRGGCSLKVGSHLFAGDTLFAGSIGRTDLPGGSYETLINSIKSLLLPLDEDTKVYSGHGPDTTIGIEKRTNPFLR